MNLVNCWHKNKKVELLQCYDLNACFQEGCLDTFVGGALAAMLPKIAVKVPPTKDPI